MEFKSGQAKFGGKAKFTDSMKQFISEEAAIFTPSQEESGVASMDRTAEKLARFSADKHKVRTRNLKQLQKKLKEKRKQETRQAKEKQKREKEKHSESPGGTYTGSSNSSAKSGTGKTEGTQQNSSKKQEKEAKKERSKETKKAATRTAVANMLKAKADLSNELGGSQVSGDAFRDGNTGLVRTVTTLINPMTYFKQLMGKLAALITPYILIFVTMAAVVFVLVALLFSIMQPIANVGEALTNILSVFTGEDGGLRNAAFTEEEIDEIVTDSGADATEETVIRFALSKVGYPYSQDLRASGRAYDCSSYAYYAWQEAGIDISYGGGYPPTAAAEARMLEEDGKKTELPDLKPGDLVFYGGKPNGSYMGIYHVAVYVGNGYAAEAYNTEYGVVYQKLRTRNACMVCRPNR